MTSASPGWPDAADAVIRGDLTVAAANVTPADGAVVTSVAPVGLADREAGRVGFTTSLGLPKEPERILRDPHVSVAHHTRDHGFAASGSYVVAQGTASVDLRPSPERLAELMWASEPFLGETRRGPIRDWLLRENHQERVFIDVEVERVAVWPDPAAHGPMTATGAAWPEEPNVQKSPEERYGPARRPRRGRTADRRAAAPAAGLPRCRRPPCDCPGGGPRARRREATARRGPWTVAAGRAQSRVPRPSLPASARPAGHAHAHRTADRHRRRLPLRPHTSTGLAAPPYKTFLTASKRLLAQYELRRTRRDGTAARAQALAAHSPMD